ncbi:MULTISPECIES: DUF393 domain-containing protein [unclassified Pseudoalteromonas]|uniref:thiol-disulfide oxidoreductase DCC family protein n=1 Tax=unclassified Pseudoalteromonas TaxID=194690 RepID=UPI000CF5F21F|nr:MULTISPECIES: DUF393 domain-containing protein [unclassified Pseudoalteromonas]MBS3797734.1 DUF393 domain-containing protein [Pseudoalteromonas sp. BDTF-M6]
MLTLFYDGNCPLCTAEIRKLKGYDQCGALALVDINSDEDLSRYPMIDYHAANATLHAIDENGRVLLGLDANVAVWRAVGKYPWLRVLRWPLIRIVADCCYRIFANNRHRIAGWLSARSCKEQCHVGERHD